MQKLAALTVLLTIFSAGAAYAGVGSIRVGGTELRALQPPVDLTSQERGGQVPAYREAPIYEGRSATVPFWWAPPIDEGGKRR